MSGMLNSNHVGLGKVGAQQVMNSATIFGPSLNQINGQIHLNNNGSGSINSNELLSAQIYVLYNYDANTTKASELYPYYVPDSYQRDFFKFHFLTWAAANFESSSDFQLTVSPHIKYESGAIMFRSKASRESFEIWIESYSTLFFAGDLMKVLPTLPFNKKIEGVLINQETCLDSLNFPLNSAFNVDGNYAFNTGLMQCVSPWAWIVENCKKPVYKIQGGWFFESESDAVLFKMFDPASKHVLDKFGI